MPVTLDYLRERNIVGAQRGAPAPFAPRLSALRCSIWPKHLRCVERAGPITFCKTHLSLTGCSTGVQECDFAFELLASYLESPAPGAAAGPAAHPLPLSSSPAAATVAAEVAGAAAGGRASLSAAGGSSPVPLSLSLSLSQSPESGARAKRLSFSPPQTTQPTQPTPAGADGATAGILSLAPEARFCVHPCSNADAAQACRTHLLAGAVLPCSAPFAPLTPFCPLTRPASSPCAPPPLRPSVPLRLCPQLIAAILDRLSPADLIRASASCRAFRAAADGALGQPGNRVWGGAVGEHGSMRFSMIALE